MSKIENAVSFMEAIARDNSHGYDQAHRQGPDYDCSSLVGTALHKAGFNVNSGSTTRNLRTQLLKNGFKAIGIDSPRKRGDIFLKEGHHVVMCTDAKNIVHASINEKGKTTGGKTGDQTGKEICTRSFYTYKGGWDYHFRYEEQSSTSVSKPSTSTPSGNDLIRAGQQHTINMTGHYINVDGIYGSQTKANIIRCFQAAMNHDYNAWLAVDGQCGAKTINALGHHYVRNGEYQEMVRAVQVALYCHGFNPQGTDAKFGKNTEAAVKAFQKSKGLTADGIAGKNTIMALMGV